MKGHTEAGPESLRTLIYDDAGEKPFLKVLDQLLIPDEKKYIDIPDVHAAWTVIRNMNIRGAPLIAIVACLGLAVDLKSDSVSKELDEIEKKHKEDHFDAVYSFIEDKMNYLFTSRPTAVNLSNALAEMKKKVKSIKDEKDGSEKSDRERIVSTIVRYARFMLDRDANDNITLARYGADDILKNKPEGTKVSIITICNTGSLATSHYGTALGIVRAIRERGQLKKVVALETRPYNQGSRLTAFEIVEEKMPGGTLICDSMAAPLMDKETVDAAVVGADRVCANGDTANKVGSYALALAAAAHGVPFYVASPFTTLDVDMATGNDIHIEERPAEELLQSSRAPKDIAVWNPAFDVTPAKYISGIVTERGILYPSADGTFDVPGFIRSHLEAGENAPKVENNNEPAKPKLQVPINYTEQTTESLPKFLADNAPDAMEVLGTTSAGDLECVETSHGKMNHVFMVRNKSDPTKQVVVKQALPYLRSVGESWPLTVERSYFEYTALVASKAASPKYVPSVYYFSKPNALMAMQYIPPPNIILRQGLIQGIQYPSMARDMGSFCARTMFNTSGFALSANALREEVEFWAKNRDMCELTEKLVFIDPYTESPNNRWTSPQLDDDKKAIEEDQDLKIAASKTNHKFVSSVHTLIHSDLHTGSIMCSPAEGQTCVIDPEFAFMGPMAFDTGSFVANLFLNYVSQPGHSNGEEYTAWILEQIELFWESFVKSFMEMWDDDNEHTGYLYGREIHASPEAVKRCQAEWTKEAFSDTLAFAGVEMIRRIVGKNHVDDLDMIEDADVRAKCERHGLAIGKKFLKEASSITSMKTAVELAQSLKAV